MTIISPTFVVGFDNFKIHVSVPCSRWQRLNLLDIFIVEYMLVGVFTNCIQIRKFTLIERLKC